MDPAAVTLVDVAGSHAAGVPAAPPATAPLTWFPPVEGRPVRDAR